MTHKSHFNDLRSLLRLDSRLSLGIYLNMPVYGDVLQQFVGQAVIQDDSLRGNFESNLRRLLSTSFSLLNTQKIIGLLAFSEQSFLD